jgi:hypothetical protein
MKATTKNRQTSITPVNSDRSAPRVTTVTVETPEPTNDSPAVRQAWVRLYEAIVGKRRVNGQREMAPQH